MNNKPINTNPSKEFFTLLKTIEKVTKNQARIVSYNPDDISSFIVEIIPAKGVYQHAKILFQIQLMLYPREFPNVICISDIYHPNIEHGEDYHNVCLNLFDNWNRSFGLIDVIQGLIFLLYQPNIYDPISSLFNSKNTNDEVFRKNVYTSLHGGVVDGVEFLPNPGIIEYNEVCKKLGLNEENIDEIGITIHNPTEYVECESHLTTVMVNNNATQDCEDDLIGEDVFNIKEDESDNNDPLTDNGSPIGFYSDLICSRYDQPEKLSESDYGSNELFHTSIVFDMLGYAPSFYASAESDIDNGFDMSEDGAMEWNDDEAGQGSSDDNYLCLSANDEDPSNVFLTKWIQTRRTNDQSNAIPAPMTSIILTNVYNPLRDIIGTFYLFHDSQSWRFSHSSVCRIEKYDRALHLMAWLTNLCRWSMARQSYWPYTDLACDQIVCYSLFVALSLQMRSRLGSLYNYGSRNFDCLFLKL